MPGPARAVGPDVRNAPPPGEDPGGGRRPILVGLVGLLGAAAGGRGVPARAQPPASPAPTREERMVAAVMDQLVAFRRGDFAAAYRHASSGIQARFTLEAFREMVTGGYAPIARSAWGEVLDAELVSSDRGWVMLYVKGQDGEALEALYEMVEEGGAWRIDAVVTRPASAGGPRRGPTALARHPRRSA